MADSELVEVRHELAGGLEIEMGQELEPIGGSEHGVAHGRCFGRDARRRGTLLLSCLSTGAPYPPTTLGKRPPVTPAVSTARLTGTRECQWSGTPQNSRARPRDTCRGRAVLQSGRRMPRGGCRAGAGATTTTSRRGRERRLRAERLSGARRRLPLRTGRPSGRLPDPVLARAAAGRARSFAGRRPRRSGGLDESRPGWRRRARDLRAPRRDIQRGRDVRRGDPATRRHCASSASPRSS